MYIQSFHMDGFGIFSDVSVENLSPGLSIFLGENEAGKSTCLEFLRTMQGRETYKHAVRNMVHVCEEVLARNGLSGADVDLLVPHQANMRIIEAVGSRLELTGDRVFTNVEKYGNTSSASIPLALSEARAQGRIRPGSRVLMTAFGAGLTWGAALLRF